ncbi:Uncharacterised protein [Orientia tsutsugamushi]|nr:hypothetical protein OTSTA763_0046 [Orientia tsutsugamushi str. TA763]SPP25178.1 Uncharacterised protein [Orientia tsutsugamushi]
MCLCTLRSVYELAVQKNSMGNGVKADIAQTYNKLFT